MQFKALLLFTLTAMTATAATVPVSARQAGVDFGDWYVVIFSESLNCRALVFRYLLKEMLTL